MIGIDEKFQSPLFFSFIFHASKRKISLSSSFAFSIFSSSPYSVSTLPNTAYMWLSKRHQLFWTLSFLFSRVWFVRADSQVTTIALISISPFVTNYHTACGLIHVLDNAISLEAKKTGHSVFKKYPIVIHFFHLPFLLLFFWPDPSSFHTTFLLLCAKCIYDCILVITGQMDKG